MIEREHDPEDEGHIKDVLGIMQGPGEPTLIRPAPFKNRQQAEDKNFESFDRMMRGNRGVEY